jgi:hypothetical protein
MMDRRYDLALWRVRVRAEYLEMPGLQLTSPQMWRLWSLDRPTCDAVIKTLVDEGFLVANTRGAYVLAHTMP